MGELLMSVGKREPASLLVDGGGQRDQRGTGRPAALYTTAKLPEAQRSRGY